MKNVFKMFFFILLISNASTSFSQDVECKEVKFSFNLDAKRLEEAGLKVKLLLKVDKLKNDTIVLKTNVKMPIFGPQNIEAYLINKDGTSYPLTSWVDNQRNTEQSENIQFLKVLIPNKRKATVQITYNVFGSTIFGSENDDFYTSQQEHEYHYPMNIPIRRAKVSLPDSLEYFLSYKKEKKEIKEINFSFINTKKYTKKSITRGNLNINLHIPDSLINNKKIQQNIIEMQQYIDRVSAYLSSPKSADIIYINWRDDKARRAFGKALGNYAICDINFSSKGLLHELIHILLPNDVKQDSKGEYFMKESIIEWLAQFFSNKMTNIDISDSTDSISLYDAQINNHSTWNLIYVTGPLAIQQISAKCGEEKMANVIISFLEKNQNKIISYDMFITHAKRSLSNDLGNKLDYLVKTSKTF